MDIAYLIGATLFYGSAAFLLAAIVAVIALGLFNRFLK